MMLSCKSPDAGDAIAQRLRGDVSSLHFAKTKYNLTDDAPIRKREQANEHIVAVENGRSRLINTKS